MVGRSWHKIINSSEIDDVNGNHDYADEVGEYHDYDYNDDDNENDENRVIISVIMVMMLYNIMHLLLLV